MFFYSSAFFGFCPRCSESLFCQVLALRLSCLWGLWVVKTALPKAFLSAKTSRMFTMFGHSHFAGTVPYSPYFGSPPSCTVPYPMAAFFLVLPSALHRLRTVMIQYCLNLPPTLTCLWWVFMFLACCFPWVFLWVLFPKPCFLCWWLSTDVSCQPEHYSFVRIAFGQPVTVVTSFHLSILTQSISCCLFATLQSLPMKKLCVCVSASIIHSLCLLAQPSRALATELFFSPNSCFFPFLLFRPYDHDFPPRQDSFLSDSSFWCLAKQVSPFQNLPAVVPQSFPVLC